MEKSWNSILNFSDTIDHLFYHGKIHWTKERLFWWKRGEIVYNRQGIYISVQCTLKREQIFPSPFRPFLPTLLQHVHSLYRLFSFLSSQLLYPIDCLLSLLLTYYAFPVLKKFLCFQIIKIMSISHGDRSVDLPSLNVEHNYPHLLSELVMKL